MLVGEVLSLLILLLTSSIPIRVQAQQGIVLTSSGEPCFGQTVTLTCTHPNPFQDPAKYNPFIFVGFRLNGAVLDVLGDLATQQRFTQTWLNDTASNVSFNVTEEDVVDGVITCSCFQVLTGGGGREESDPITMDVEAIIRPPTIVFKPNSTPGLLQWNSPSSNCSNYRYIFTLNWTRMEDGSTGTVSTEEDRYDYTGMTGGEYTVSLKARATNFNLNESEPVHDCWITIIQPPTLVSKPTSTSGLLRWRPSSSCSNYQYIFTLTWVRIGDGSTGTVSNEENRYDFTGMPAGEYSAIITAAIAGLDESEPLVVSSFVTGHTSSVCILCFAIPLVVILLLIVFIVLIVVIYCLCRNRQKRVSHSHSADATELG